ncbi:tail fiber protein [Sporosarcina sp. USHLN248]|uniref:tail fiber protein n=1 Tax=Sporosarcina sp. USHLN248 TaxID=3081300 RepID=UPI003019A016
MAYQPTDWKNREVERPRTFMLQNNDDGTITLIPAEGKVTEPGTPIVAPLMNKIEDQLVVLDEFAESKGRPNGIATLDGSGSVPMDQLQNVPLPQDATTSRKGVVQLDDTVNSNSKAKAATANAVKQVNDKLTSEDIAIGTGAKFSNNTGAGAIALGSYSVSYRSSLSPGIAIGALAEANNHGTVAIGFEANSPNLNEGVLGVGSSITYGPKIWKVPGELSVTGTKKFEMPHPHPDKKDTHIIRHGAVESPTAGDNLYRYVVRSSKTNDIQYIDLPDYFVWLNKNVQVFVTPQGHFGNGYGIFNKVDERLEIHCQTEGEYNVLVIGTRNDDHESVQTWDIKGVEREIGESWTGETYVFEDEEFITDNEYLEEVVA